MAFKLPGLSRGGSKPASTNVDTILESGDVAQATAPLPFLAGGAPVLVKDQQGREKEPQGKADLQDAGKQAAEPKRGFLHH